MVDNGKIVITNPSPLLRGKQGSLTYFSDDVYNSGLIIPGHDYILQDKFGIPVSEMLTFSDGGVNENCDNCDEPIDECADCDAVIDGCDDCNVDYALYFKEVVINNSGLNILTLVDVSDLSNQIPLDDQIYVEVSAICFKSGTKILCMVDKKEIYIPIEKIQEDMYVKTYNPLYKNGVFKKARFILKSYLSNTKEHSINKMFKLSKDKNNLLLEDLYVTGGHAILYDYLTEEQTEDMKKMADVYNNYEVIIPNKEMLTQKQIDDTNTLARNNRDMKLKIMNKFKLLAYYDYNFEELNIETVYTIYHLVLENTNIYDNYAIYANGILAESTSEDSLSRFEDYEKVNCKSINIINNNNVKEYNDMDLKIKRAMNKKNKMIFKESSPSSTIVV